MNLVIGILISIIISLAGIYVIFDITSNINDIDEEYVFQEFETYTSSSEYIISGQFKIEHQCRVLDENSNELYLGDFSRTFQARLDLSSFSSGSILNVRCCNMKNNCDENEFQIP